MNVGMNSLLSEPSRSDYSKNSAFLGGGRVISVFPLQSDRISTSFLNIIKAASRF